MNILILSAGTRTKVVEYFVREMRGEGKVIGADMSRLAPAIYAADKYYLVPPVAQDDYIDVVLDICRRENIGGVFSLIDPELSLLAKNADRFEAAGVTVCGSDYDLCEMSLNKMKMYEFLRSHGIKCAESYVDKQAFYRDSEQKKTDFPVIIKPVCGSASSFVRKISSRQALEYEFSARDDLMIQRFLSGEEIGADVYIDGISGETVSIFTKKKLLMRAGETDKAVSFIDEKLNELIKKFVAAAGYRYMIDIDIFLVDGEYYISEVNPRFGGGYPHAHECGCNHVAYLINNLCGRRNTPRIGEYAEGVYMMKYNEIKILKESI